MKVIDSHMHLGECRIFGLNVAEEQLLKYFDKYNITAAVVQPFPGAPDPVETHNRIFELSKRLKGKVYGMASINPHLGEEVVARELDRVLGELGFVAIKLHTLGHAIPPANPRATVLFEKAAKYRVPVMVHTGPGPFSDPVNVAPRAEEYTDVKIILAHAGFGVYTPAAMWLAKKYDNIYLEPSWVPVYDLAMLVAETPDKLLFGTDLLENTPVEFAKIESLQLPDDVREQVLYKNAKEVFNLKL